MKKPRQQRYNTISCREFEVRELKASVDSRFDKRKEILLGGIYLTVGSLSLLVPPNEVIRRLELKANGRLGLAAYLLVVLLT